MTNTQLQNPLASTNTWFRTGLKQFATLRHATLALACTLLPLNTVAQTPTLPTPEPPSQTCVIRGQIASLVAAGAKAKVKNLSL